MYNAVTEQWVDDNSDKFGTLASFVNDPNLSLGMAVRVIDRDDYIFDVVNGETADGYGIVAHATLSLQLKIRLKSKGASVSSFGGVEGGDFSPVVTAMIAFPVTNIPVDRDWETSKI